MTGIAAICAATLSVQPACAWGPLGHRIAADIAQRNIDGRAAASIEQIIGRETLAEGSTWPDEERANPSVFWQETASPWHYVTAPEGTKAAEIEHPEHGDALTALDRFVTTLRNPAASPEEKALALRFVVHLVADLHLPLHAGNGTDRGGNDFKVLWFDEPNNLHWVWDEGMLLRRQYSFSEYSVLLQRHITSGEVLSWWDVHPETWVDESIALRATVYPRTGGDLGEGTMESPAVINWQYQYDQIGKAEQRLSQAGIRIAAYLDWIFSEGE